MLDTKCENFHDYENIELDKYKCKICDNIEHFTIHSFSLYQLNNYIASHTKEEIEQQFEKFKNVGSDGPTIKEYFDNFENGYK